jgi:hypothetical protein
VSVLLTLPCCLFVTVSIVFLEVRYCDTSSNVFLVEAALTIWGLFAFHMNLRIFCSIFYEERHKNFHVNSTEFGNGFSNMSPNNHSFNDQIIFLLSISLFSKATKYLLFSKLCSCDA